MKKITLFLLILLYSFTSYGQFPEGFEESATTLPTNWDQYQNGVGTAEFWKISSLVSTPPFICEGLNSAFVNRENIGAGNTSEDYLVSPLFTVVPNAQLRFSSRQAFVGNQGTKFQIKISTNADKSLLSAYVLVQEYTETEMNTTFNLCQLQTLSLSAYSGQSRVSTIPVTSAQEANIFTEEDLLNILTMLEKRKMRNLDTSPDLFLASFIEAIS